MFISNIISFFFFFNDTATTEIYTLSLHDALPIFVLWETLTGQRLFANLSVREVSRRVAIGDIETPSAAGAGDRKSTRLNSSHLVISYAVFCLKKKKKKTIIIINALQQN